MPLARLCSMFSVPATPPALARAQLSALRKQVPLLYVIIVINSCTLAYAHYGVAPTSQLLIPLLVLSGACLSRAVAWVRLDLDALATEKLVPLLHRTNNLTAVLSPAILVWALNLERFGDETTNLYVFFYLAVTAVACVFCLMHLRSAALIIVATVTVPAVASVLLRHEPILKAYAVSQTLVGAVMVFILFVYNRDFVQLVGQNEALESLGSENLHLASTDMLTSLPNRRSFFAMLEETFRRTAAGEGSHALGIIDLDGFKGVNDTYGHVAGDRVLTEVADRLRGAIPRSAALARIGGDEFALILRVDEPGHDLNALSRAIFSSINRPFAFGGASARIGASIGFAHFAEAEANATHLIERADFALYEAKAHRRGTFVVFAQEHEARMRLQSDVEHALRDADLACEFSLAFQPIVDIGRQRTVAFEALARWQSPRLGWVRPDHFIAVAERIGTINELTQVLLGKALDAMSAWPAEVMLSFNLSMFDITSPEAIERICAAIEASPIDPARLQFEVTETAMLSDFAQAQAGLNRLKVLGASVALDDFGTGYSSLSYVHRLPVDKLKIDQSFTRELLTQESARNIVGSIIELSRRLNLGCVVEGVETREQADLLNALGCRFVQGYLIRKPMPAHEVGPYLDLEACEPRSLAAA